MTVASNTSFIILGGASGVAATLCYIAAVTVSFPPAAAYVVVMAWPVLSIVFLFALNRYLGRENQSHANHLALLFACLAFTLVALMISVQMAVTMGMDESIAAAAGSPDRVAQLQTIRDSMRWVDLGIDVAWDIFIGTALLFLSAALFGHSGFGRWWGVSSGFLGAALIILNVSTFPWPPADRDLFDIGPVIGLYIILLSTRLIVLGRKMSHRGSEPAESASSRRNGPTNHPSQI
jgi:hypothetical protein